MIPLRYDLPSDRIAQQLTFGAHGEQWVTLFVNANGQVTVEHLTDEEVAGWLVMAEGVHEHGLEYPGGAVLVWPNDDPQNPWLRIIPLEERVRDARENGGKVLRRKVIVIQEWEEVQS